MSEINLNKMKKDELITETIKLIEIQVSKDAALRYCKALFRKICKDGYYAVTCNELRDTYINLIDRYSMRKEGLK